MLAASIGGVSSVSSLSSFCFLRGVDRSQLPGEAGRGAEEVWRRRPPARRILEGGMGAPQWGGAVIAFAGAVGYASASARRSPKAVKVA